MSDVFISYARSTAPQAQRLSGALQALGYSVWLDDQLPAHRAYTEVIEERLRAARSVVVVWSADAKKSDWVRAEADVAREAGKLVQVTVDGSLPPLPFSQIQCADLTGWAGDPNAAGWRKAAASVEALVGAAGQADAHRMPQGAPPPSEPLLAVLPFDNVSSDVELSFFSDGVSDEIRETIARGADLKVIGRGSSFRFRGAEKSAANVAAQVKATHVLDGAVQRSGQKLRITAELVDCATETAVWTHRFDRDLSDIFALQDEIAAAVAEALRVAIALPDQAPAVDAATYDRYLAAREASFGPYGLTGLLGAFDRLRQATGEAPLFARAWADLARTGSLLWRHHEHSRFPHLTREVIVEAAQTALRLDPGLGIAYQALAELERFDDFLAREALHEQALAHAKSDPAVLTSAALFLSEVGRLDEAVQLAAQAARIDPLFGFAEGLHAGLLTGVGRHGEAHAIWDRLLEAQPTSAAHIHNALYAAASAADWARFDALQTKARAAGAIDSGLEKFMQFWTAVRVGDAAAKARYLQDFEKDFAAGGLLQNDVIQHVVALGDVERAFGFVQRYSLQAASEGRLATTDFFGFAGTMFMSGNEPMMRDARFVQLCRRIGLCDYWIASDRWPDCADEGVLPYDFKALCAAA
jgi:TolB-like protein